MKRDKRRELYGIYQNVLSEIYRFQREGWPPGILVVRLFSLIVSAALSIVALATFFLTFLEWIFTLVMLLPSLAVTVRRLHDTNRPAWWLLLLVPPVGFIGWIPLLIFCVLPGTAFANRYGPNPSQPQQGMGGFGYTQSGHPYNPPPAEGHGTSGYGAAQPEPSPESDTDERRFCTQCGMQLQADARFCTVCGTPV